MDANKAAHELLEVKSGTLIGKIITSFTDNNALNPEKINKKQRSTKTKIKVPSGEKHLEITTSHVNHQSITSYSIIRDITERENHETKYRKIFEKSSDLILITSAQGVIFINPAGVRYLELDTPDEIIGKSTLEFIHPDYQKITNEYAAQRRAGGNPPNQYRCKMITKQGKTRYVEFHASYIEWNGKPSSLTIVRDISKQIQLEEELRKSREQLYDFIESATDAFSILDEDLRYVMVNETELKFSGLQREDYIGKHILEVFPDLEKRQRYLGYKKVLETGESVYYPNVTTISEDGRRFDYSAFKAGDLLGIVARDITERKRLEDEKERAYAELSTIYESSPIIMLLVDDQRRVRTANHVSSKFAQRPLEEMKGKRGGEAIRCIHHVDDPRGCGYGEACQDCTIKKLVVNTLETGESYDQVEATLETRTNQSTRISNLLVSTAPIKVEKDSLVLVSIQDITELKSYQCRIEALHLHASQLARLDSLSDIATGTMKILNNLLGVYNGSFGYVKEDNIEFIVHSSDRKMSKLYLNGKGVAARAVKTGKTQLVLDTRKDPDYISGTVNGDPDVLSELVVPIKIDGKVVAIINLKDNHTNAFTEDDKQIIELLAEHISSRLTTLRLETERIRADLAEKMEEIKTRFMRTATHELRTPLTSMKGFLELAKNETDPEILSQYLDIAYRNTDRLEALTNDLLDQQRLEDGRIDLIYETLDLTCILHNVLEEVSNLINKKDQTIKIDIPEKTFIKGDKLRIEQVLINIIDNASKYSPNGTRIDIKIEENNEDIQVIVADNGIGLSEEDIHKLFQPFPDIEHPTITDQSIGLGLSICKGIINLHGGEIWGESPGIDKGSTFYFTLPKAISPDTQD